MNCLITLLFTLVAPGTVLGLIPYWILRAANSELPTRLGVVQWIGLLLAAAGLAVYAWTASDFVRIGNGTPAPIFPTRRLVVKGLYRYVRNPMYLGVLTVLAGEACFFRSVGLLIAMAFFWIATALFVIYYEEPTLKRTYGEEYMDYLRNVRRWIPETKPYHPLQS